jgi:hypothetical protein
VYVAGWAQGRWRSPRSAHFFTLDDMVEGGARVAAKLWDNSGLRRDDVDVPQLYDGFSPFVYFWLEALGYCPRGEGLPLRRRRRHPHGTGLPVLSGGGALGNGRMHGVPADARVLPAAVTPRRRTPTAAGGRRVGVPGGAELRRASSPTRPSRP